MPRRTKTEAPKSDAAVRDTDERPIGATYARISGPSDARTASLDTQEEESVAKLEAEGYRVPPEYRFREQFTGMESIYDREVLVRIRDLIARREIKALCCYDTDRLARDPGQLTGVVVNTEKSGCNVFFVLTDRTTDRTGDLLLYVRGYASAVEYDAIKDRTMRGRRKVLEAGNLMGNGPTRFGYVYNPETRRRVAHPALAAIVVWIFEAIRDGASSIQVAEDLTARGIPTPSGGRGQKYKDGRGQRWNHSTIRGIIRDRTYLGESTAVRSTVVGRHKSGKSRIKMLPESEWKRLRDGMTEALVSPELWHAANDALVRRRNQPLVRPDRDTHLLAGMIYCARCGLRMTTTTKKANRVDGSRGGNGKVYLYRCTAKHPGRQHKVECPASSLSASKYDAAAWAGIVAKLTKPGELEAEMDAIKSGAVEEQIRGDLDKAQVRRKTADRRIRNLAESFADANSRTAREAIHDKMRALEAEARDIDRQIQDLQSRLAPFEHYQATRDRIRELVAKIRGKLLNRDLTFAEKRDILKGLRAQVHAAKDQDVRITVLFEPSAEGANSDSSSRTTSAVGAPQRIRLEFVAMPLSA